jgi:hypothetical protein
MSTELQIVLAYIDPGMGALLYQAALASLLGVVFYWRKLWDRVSRILGRPGSGTAGK